MRRVERLLATILAGETVAYLQASRDSERHHRQEDQRDRGIRVVHSRRSEARQDGAARAQTRLDQPQRAARGDQDGGQTSATASNMNCK